jgi:anthranilate phosphoribosyltransferase
MSLRDAILVAVRGEEVPAVALEAAFGEIVEGEAAPVRIAALLIALRTKGETVGEIVAAARALRARAVTESCVDPRTVDTCGTGGDGAHTFNISTAAAFVVAGAGVPVAKHGNRAASSRTGSIDVLEALGVKVDLPIDVSAQILREIGIAPFYARRAHPAMRFVAPVRQELGIRTLMNCLGPLLNPVGVRFQLVGVYADSLVQPLAEALGQLGAIRAMVVRGSDGLDEITTAGPTHAALLEDGAVRSMTIEPGSFEIPPPVPGALRGGDAAQNATIVKEVLEGEPGARRDIVLLNAAAALWVAGAGADLAEGLDLARESVDSGAARRLLEQLIRATALAE